MHYVQTRRRKRIKSLSLRHRYFNLIISGIKPSQKYIYCWKVLLYIQWSAIDKFKIVMEGYDFHESQKSIELLEENNVLTYNLIYLMDIWPHLYSREFKWVWAADHTSVNSSWEKIQVSNIRMHFGRFHK